MRGEIEKVLNRIRERDCYEGQDMVRLYSLGVPAIPLSKGLSLEAEDFCKAIEIWLKTYTE